MSKDDQVLLAYRQDMRNQITGLAGLGLDQNSLNYLGLGGLRSLL